MSDKPSGTWGIFDAVSKIWPVVIGALFLVGFYFTTTNRLDSLQATITTMQSLDIPNRVGKLEDERTNDVANVNMQIASLTAQLAALQSGENDLGKGISGITQQLATLQAQMAFLINQNWPSRTDGK
jgi:septal ring factor EnvC (AmiA/AmiB activator)